MGLSTKLFRVREPVSVLLGIGIALPLEMDWNLLLRLHSLAISVK